MTKHALLFFTCLLIFIPLANTSAETTTLESEVITQSSGADLDVGATSAPTVSDWDNDGDGDLIMGLSSDGGKLRIYENVGSDDVPVFDGYVKLQSAGRDISDPDC